MDKSEILNKLKKIVASVKDIDIGELEFVTDETTIKDDLGLNSIGVLYVVIAIEREFDISMQDADVSTFITVGDVVDFIYENY